MRTLTRQQAQFHQLDHASCNYASSTYASCDIQAYVREAKPLPKLNSFNSSVDQIMAFGVLNATGLGPWQKYVRCTKCLVIKEYLYMKGVLLFSA